MPWAVTIRNLVSGQNELLDLGEGAIIPALDDPTYADEAHLLPVFKVENDRVLFGHHRCARDCICGPKIVKREGKRDIVIHNLIN